MRDPSVHVTESVLLSIMPDVLKCTSPEDAVKLIFRLTKGKALIKRSLVSSNAKTKKKIQKLVDSSDANVRQFQAQLLNYRKIINHNHAKQIMVGDSDYGLLREVALMADEFIADFCLPQVTGYIEFIKRGIALMGRQYAIGKFKYYRSKIYEQFENSQIIKADTNKKGSTAFYNTWQDLMLEYTGTSYELTTDEEKVHMVFGRQEADEIGADYYTYLKSQFEGLAFMNVVPEFGALYGVKAKSRYRKYIVEVKKPDEVVTVNKKHMTDEQIRYQALRNERSKKQGC
jgi:hypothetical protein